ncbi:MAG: vWA domain-containing protein [Phototrophicaceae bacterium]
MSFLVPLAFVGSLLSIPVILLYMLRLRRQDVMVSSTFLWQQVLQDNEANSPWQRLRRNWLLLLQLLILALLVFALARPFIIVPTVSTGQIVLLIDASASMSATDLNGQTRLEAAKARAQTIVGALSGNDRVTVIRVADVPEVISPESRDRLALRDAISRIIPSSAPSDWGAALTLATGIAEGEDFSVVILSDGNLGDVTALPGVAGDIEYIPIGENAGNIAISALATRALAGGSPQLFTQLTNYGTSPAEVVFSLRIDGVLDSSERYTLPANSSIPIVIETLPEGFEVIQAQLIAAANSTTEDYLALDNSAWAVADSGGVIEALMISPGGLFLDRVLGSLPTVRHLLSDVQQGVPSRDFDLYIFDSYLPTELPDGDMLIINPPRSTNIFTLGEPSEDTLNPVVQPNDTRTAFLDFDSVNIRAFRPVNADWLEPLVTVDGGAVILAGENAGRQIAVIAFPLEESDLPLQIAFPILINNLMDWFQPETLTLPAGNLVAGDSIPLQLPATATRATITTPSGATRDYTATGEVILYSDTAQLGVYRVAAYANNRLIQQGAFAVNLFAPNESAIAPHATIQLGEVEIQQSAQEEVGQRELWIWLALAALLILMLEWWVHHRRISGADRSVAVFGRG